MSTFLGMLPLEIAEVGLIEPTQEKGEDESVIGEIISDDNKRLYSLWKQKEKAAALQKVEEDFSEESSHGRAYELRYKAHCLGELFWTSIIDELNIWETASKSSLAIRKGWLITSSRPPVNPLIQMFRYPGMEGGPA